MQTKLFVNGALVAGQGELLPVLVAARGRGVWRVAVAPPGLVAGAGAVGKLSGGA